MTTTDESTIPRKTLRQEALTLPNLLTLVRIVLIPVVLWLLVEGTPQANFWAAVVYIASAVTDFFDGYLARRLGLISVLGKFIDPLADKLLVMATLVFIAYLGRLPLLGVVAVIVMIGRELAITALRAIAIGEGVVIAAGSGGKDKTAFQMSAILFLIVQHRYQIDFLFFEKAVDFGEVGLWLLYISSIFALTSAAQYLNNFGKALAAKEEEEEEEEAESGA